MITRLRPEQGHRLAPELEADDEAARTHIQPLLLAIGRAVPPRAARQGARPYCGGDHRGPHRPPRFLAARQPRCSTRSGTGPRACAPRRCTGLIADTAGSIALMVRGLAEPDRAAGQGRGGGLAAALRRERQIVALAEQTGYPRARLALARFRAPQPRRLARPTRLRVRREAKRLIVRWSKVKRAHGYEVRINLPRDGRRLLRFTRPQQAEPGRWRARAERRRPDRRPGNRRRGKPGETAHRHN